MITSFDIIMLSIHIAVLIIVVKDVIIWDI
jgi:hypothetical protein